MTTEISLGEVKRTTLGIRFVDPIGHLFPTNYATINYQKSELNYMRQDNIVIFSGNIRADISTPQERAVDSEGNQLDSYLMLTLELPFKNVMDYPIPVTMSSSRVFGFYRMRENSNGMFTSSLKAYIAPNSNLVFFEFISSEESNYTSNLVLLKNRSASLWISIQGTAFVEDSQVTSEPWNGYQGHYWT